MLDRTNLVYRYDGTYQGFLCCVAQCFTDKHLPQAVQLWEEPQATLFPIQGVDTDPALARRVERSLWERISPEAFGMVRDGFLSCQEQRELLLLRFVLLGYKYGKTVTRLTAKPEVYEVWSMVRAVRNEAHYHLEFLRFSDLGGFLVGEITPKNTVLPLIAGHFCDRLPEEDFVLYDRAHGMGFFHRRGGQREFFHAEGIDLPPPGEEEEQYRALWKRFHQTIAVEGRRNPKLQRSLCPKRYWPNMTEFQP